MDSLFQFCSFGYTRPINCIEGFNFPLTLKNDQVKLRIYPTQQWKSTDLKGDEAALFDPAAIDKLYYIGIKEKS